MCNLRLLTSIFYFLFSQLFLSLSLSLLTYSLSLWFLGARSVPIIFFHISSVSLQNSQFLPANSLCLLLSMPITLFLPPLFYFFLNTPNKSRSWSKILLLAKTYPEIISCISSFKSLIKHQTLIRYSLPLKFYSHKVDVSSQRVQHSGKSGYWGAWAQMTQGSITGPKRQS